jgi:hypothetical protein
MSPESSTGYCPGWEFLDNPKLRQLQQSLDTSLCDYSGAEDLRAKCATFRAALLEHFEQLLSQEDAIDETELRQTVEFLRRSFATLSTGGINAGRSEQDRDLNASNQVLVDRIGEKKYYDLVQQYEDRVAASYAPGNPAGDII